MASTRIQNQTNKASPRPRPRPFLGPSLIDHLGEKSVGHGAYRGVDKGFSRLSVLFDDDEEPPKKKSRLDSATPSGVAVGFGEDTRAGAHSGEFEGYYDDDEEFAV